MGWLTNRILSIIIPVYNEQETIVTILQRVAAVTIPGVSFEVIVIDDGSKDQTRQLLKENSNLVAKLIFQEKNGGKGAAVKAGLQQATGDFVLFQDADLEYDPRDYPKLLKALTDYDADVVMGSRNLAPEIIRVHSGANKFGNWLLTLSFNFLFNKTFSDIYTCYLAFKRGLVNPNELRTEGFEQQAEILSYCVLRGHKFYEVPINYHGRDVSEGKKIKAWHAFAVLWTMFYCRLRKQTILRRQTRTELAPAS